MKMKRIASWVLTLCMLAALLPATAPRAQAADISYTRFNAPEFAILNYYTGNNDKFYDSVFKDTRYNAVQAGKFVDGGSKLNYDDENGKNRTYTWAGFANTNLALLSDQTGELRINYSTTLHTKIHPHSWWTSPFTKAKQDCYGRMSAQLWFTAGSGSNQKTNGTYYAAQYSDNSKNEFNRKGNMSWSEMPLFNGAKSACSMINGESTASWKRTDLNLTFTNHNYNYDGGSRTCTCGGWAKNNVVTFYDGTAPTIRAVETRRNGVATTNFKPGDTIQVVLKFSEPVRLADDNAGGKSDVTIGLLVNKSGSDPLFATFKSLTCTGYYGPGGARPTWEAVFEYTVPTTVTGLLDIKGIDLTTGANPLVRSTANVPLKQVCGGSSFNVSVPAGANAEGFTQSKSYITDLAGNALKSTVPSVSFSIDAERPFVAQTVMNAALNNSGIKDRKTEGEPERDNSDIFLGVGDSFSLTVYLNEVVNYTGKENVFSAPDIATATLNILDKDNNPVTVPLYFYYDVSSGSLGSQFGLGASNGRVSMLKSSGTVKIADGMHLPAGKTDIIIQSIAYDPAYNVCDASGNIARDEVHDTHNSPPDNLAPTMGYCLDADGPTVNVDPVVQNGLNTEFYVPFLVKDSDIPNDQTVSGAAGMLGSVTLSAASGEKSAFTYAVNGSATTDELTVWKTGHLGEKLSIVETGAPQYLHVRQAKDARYDFNELTASFYLTDYAGNGVTRPADLTNVVWDNVAPTAGSGTASRVFDNVNTRGVLTVPVTAKDTCGVKSAAFLWADADAEITAESVGWTPLTFTQGDTSVTDDVVVYVPNGESFSKTLWLKAEDMGGNVAVEKKNAYSYSLKALRYGLEYTTNVQSGPWIKYTMNSMDPGDGFFIVDVHKKTDEDENGNATVHWINVGMDGGFAGGQTDDGGFMDINFGWHKATVDEDPTTHVRTVYIIDNDVDYAYGAGKGTGLMSTSHGYGLYDYNGEIEVTIYSGTMQATLSPDTNEPTLVKTNTQWGTRWWYNSQRDPIIMDNSVGVEHFTLRVVHENDCYVQNADSARIRCEFTYVDPQLHALTDIGNWWSADDAYDTYGVNSTLAGMKVAFKLTDTYGWDFDGIDWDNSYFRLNSYLGQQIAKPDTDLRIAGIQPGQTEQTVIFPATEIPSGKYDNMTLFLARTEAPGDPYQFYVKTSDMSNTAQEIEIDSTEPGSLVPGLLSYQPFTKFFNYEESYGEIIDSEKSADFPRSKIEYDPTGVIYVPAGNVRVDLMFQALTAADADGDGELDPAYHRGRQAGYGQYDAVAWNTSAADPDATLTFLQGRTERNSTTNETLDPCWDAYDTEMACFGLDGEGNIVTLPTAGQDLGQLCLTLNATGKDLVERSGGKNFALTLIPDQDNVIAVQMRYLNGKTSDVVYLTVHPVSSEMPQGTVTTEPAIEGESEKSPYGTIVGESGATAVRFTPAEGENTAGMRFYLCNGFYRYVNERLHGLSSSSGGMHYWNNLDVRNPVEMTPQGDGSFLALVPDYDDVHYGYYFTDSGSYTLSDGVGLRHYVVVAQDAMGALWVLPSPTNSILTDSDGPKIKADPAADASSGVYTVNYTIHDESLYACVGTSDYRSRSSSAPLTLTFSYDEAYSALAGTGSFTVVYDPAEAFEKGSVSYSSGVTTVVYELPVSGNTLGITSVTATLTTTTNNSYYGLAEPSLVLAVKGSISMKWDSAADVVLTLKAEDRFGHNSVPLDDEGDTAPCELSVTLENAVGAAPHFVSAEYKLTGNTVDGWQQDRALYMHFSGPVQPVASWICPQPKGYEATWADGFPITHDGEWTISYYDMLDNLITETITLTDVFGDFGFNLELSTTDYTEDAITVSLSREGSDETLRDDYMAFMPLPDDLQSFESWETGIWYGIEREIEQNGDYAVLRAPYHSGGMAVSWHNWDYKSSWKFSDLEFRRLGTDYTIIHIGNYVNGRPGETISLYFDDNGREYTAPLPESRRGETDDAVTIRYTTSRDTDPVGSGETSKTFRAGDDDSFSFTYYDAVTDAEYTISGRLSDYGVTLTAPAVIPEDTNAPQIGSVTVWKQLGSRFERAEAFRGDADEAEIADVFSVYVDDAHPGRCGWASGYDLVLSVSDVSDWKLLLCASEPAALTYDAASAEITGVSLQGNNVLITPEVTGVFWIAAVDAHDNFSFFRLDPSWLHFDGAAPVITASDPVVTEFYERTIYLKAADDHTAAERIVFTGDGVEANDDSNAAYPAADWPYMVVFYENTENLPVTATDDVGNSVIISLSVDGIDSSKPTLTVTWSPCFRNPVTGKLNRSAPTAEPTNVDVVAHISSDKPLAGAAGTVRITAPDYQYEQTAALPNGPYSFYYPNPVYYEASENMVTVTFADSDGYIDTDGDGYGDTYAPVAYEVALTVWARNRQSAEVILSLGAGIVDKEAPWLYQKDYTPLYREKLNDAGDVTGSYDIAYGYAVTMRFDEDARITGGDFTADPGHLLPAGEPFSTVVYDNGQRSITFMDKAGNADTEDLAPPTPVPVDNDKPELSVFNEDALTAVGNTAVTVQIRIDEASDIDSVAVSNPSAVTFDLNAITTETDAATNEDYRLLPLSVSKNGTYRLTVTDKAGNIGSTYFGVSNLDLTLPTIRFETPTVSLRQGSTDADLTAALEKAEEVLLWDNVDNEATLRGSLQYFKDGFTLNGTEYAPVNLNQPGVYEVRYTVTDTAGNIGSAIRLVRVYSAQQPDILVDGRATEPNGTLSVRPGGHALTVNLINVEPYTVKLVKGIWSVGQLKYVNAGLSVADDGSFTLSAGGFYTLYILTQSRQSYRVLLYAEN